jgi:hypothetical protein
MTTEEFPLELMYNIKEAMPTNKRVWEIPRPEKIPKNKRDLSIMSGKRAPISREKRFIVKVLFILGISNKANGTAIWNMGNILGTQK